MATKLTTTGSDYIKSAAGSFRRLSLDEVPPNHPVDCFNKIFEHLREPDGSAQRRKFDPLLHPAILPWVQIFDVLDQGRYRNRLMGTRITELLKGDFTGRILDEYIGGELLEQREGEFSDALAQQSPIFSTSKIRAESGPDWLVYRGIFPFQDQECPKIFVILAEDDQRLETDQTK